MKALVAFGLSSVTAHSRAQGLPGRAAPAGDAAPAPGQAANRAKIVLIGQLGRDRHLAALLRELLGADGIRVEIVGAGRFEPDSLFAEGDGGATLVFVSLRDERSVRLHFRAPSGDRFLLRKVELPSDLDAVGRELLGQVVKSSVAVLLHSPRGLSRAEASAALARDAAPSEAFEPRSEVPAAPTDEPAPTGDSAPAPRDGLAPPNERTSSRTPATAEDWAFGAGIGYSVEWAGSDLPVAHGPGAALEARSTSTPHFGVKLGAQRLFPQPMRTPLVSADVQRTDVQVSLELGVPLAPGRSGFLALGPSLEVSRLEPTSGAPGVAIAPAKTDISPALRGEARHELAFGPCVLGVVVYVNVSLADTHYDVEDGGLRVRAASLGAVRPGGALMLGLM